MRPRSTPNASSRTLTIGTKQLVVQEAFETTLCCSGSNVSSFTPTTKVASTPLPGAEITTKGAPASRCFAAAARSVKRTGRLDDDVDAELAPRERRRIAFGEDLDRVPVDLDAVADDLDIGLEPPEDRVELQQMCHQLERARVVGRHEVHVHATFLGGAEEVPPDPAEAVDTYADRPCESSSG